MTSGRLGIDLDEGVAHRIAQAFARVTAPTPWCLARDCRESSPALADAVAAGLVAVLDLGLAGMYFTIGAIVVADHRLLAITLVERRVRGAVQDASATRAAYVARIAALVGPVGPLRVLVNSGNGAAGPTLDVADGLAGTRKHARLDWCGCITTRTAAFRTVSRILLAEIAPDRRRGARGEGDIGVAFDGDFDRCFLFDGAGQFVDGEHVVALLARAHLALHPRGDRPRSARAVGRAGRHRAGRGRSVLAPRAMCS